MTGPLPPRTTRARSTRRRAGVLGATLALVVTAGCSSDSEPDVQSPPISAGTDAQTPGDATAAAPTAPGATPSPDSPTTDPSPATGDGGGGVAAGTLPDQQQGELLGQFVNFALRPSSDDVVTVDFADQVDLGLGTEVRRTLPPSDLGNPRRWMLPAEGAFAASGFLSALASITAQAERALTTQRDTGIFRVTAGPHSGCGGRSSAPLDGYTADQQISVLPGEGSIESCLDWFAVDLYVDDAGSIAAVRLDLVEP